MKTFRLTFDHFYYIDIQADTFTQKHAAHVRFEDDNGELVAEYYDGDILSIDEIEAP